MGAHGRKRPIGAKAAGAVAVVAAAGLAVGLVAASGDSDDAAAGRESAITLSPFPQSATPQESTTEPEISSKPVTAAPRPTTPATTTAPSPTSGQSTPAAPPSSSAPAPAPSSSAPAAPTTPAARTVPNVVGSSVDDAAAALAAAGYRYKVVCQQGPSTGRVASQQPAAGQQWNIGGEVALFVSFWRCRSDSPGRPWDDD